MQQWCRSHPEEALLKLGDGMLASLCGLGILIGVIFITVMTSFYWWEQASTTGAPFWPDAGELMLVLVATLVFGSGLGVILVSIPGLFVTGEWWLHHRNQLAWRHHVLSEYIKWAHVGLLVLAKALPRRWQPSWLSLWDDERIGKVSVWRMEAWTFARFGMEQSVWEQWLRLPWMTVLASEERHRRRQHEHLEQAWETHVAQDVHQGVRRERF